MPKQGVTKMNMDNMDNMDKKEQAWFNAAKNLCEEGRVEQVLHLVIGSIPRCNLTPQTKFMEGIVESSTWKPITSAPKDRWFLVREPTEVDTEKYPGGLTHTINTIRWSDCDELREYGLTDDSEEPFFMDIDGYQFICREELEWSDIPQ